MLGSLSLFKFLVLHREEIFFEINFPTVKAVKGVSQLLLKVLINTGYSIIYAYWKVDNIKRVFVLVVQVSVVTHMH